MIDLSFFLPLVPYLPFIGTLLGILLGGAVPFYLMNLQSKKLKGEILQIAQNINTAKTTAVRDQATALETLERVAATTAEELEKSLEKSITLGNLRSQVELQKSQLSNQQGIISLQTEKIDKLTDDVSFEHNARILVESKVVEFEKLLASERLERQTAVAEIENLKLYSDRVIQKLTARVKKLEEYIRHNGLTVPNGP